MSAQTIVFTKPEIVVLIRSMAGVFLDDDAGLRMDVLRKLAKANQA